jgi:RNA polymerase sigma-70 factor (sigma-E family)
VPALRDIDYTEYVSGRLPSLRRLALLLCHDWQRADDLVQATITRLFLRWPRAVAVDNLDGYVRTILFREFLHERRSSWARRVSLTGALPETPAASADRDTAMDLQAAIAALPPRQRAALVLRFYCDLDVSQSALVLGCSAGTVKSQTSRALAKLRHALEADPAASAAIRSGTAERHPHGEVTGNA